MLATSLVGCERITYYSINTGDVHDQGETQQALRRVAAAMLKSAGVATQWPDRIRGIHGDLFKRFIKAMSKICCQ